MTASPFPKPWPFVNVALQLLDFILFSLAGLCGKAGITAAFNAGLSSPGSLYYTQLHSSCLVQTHMMTGATHNGSANHQNIGIRGTFAYDAWMQ